LITEYKGNSQEQKRKKEFMSFLAKRRDIYHEHTKNHHFMPLTIERVQDVGELYRPPQRKAMGFK